MAMGLTGQLPSLSTYQAILIWGLAVDTKKGYKQRSGPMNSCGKKVIVANVEPISSSAIFISRLSDLQQ
jgi:hypothetical protein